MPENLVFHESFDSTRTADRDVRPNLAQAQAEALVSLLLGQTLTVNNTYAFDSRGVLDLVAAVLSARDDVRGGLRAGSATAERLTQAQPFLLCWHGSDSFLQACAKQLRTIEPVKDRFLLSAWGAIDLQLTQRAELADALLTPPHPEPPKWLTEYEGFADQFAALQAIDGYAAAYGRGMPTSSQPGTDLISYLEYYHRLGLASEADGAGGQLRALAPESGCPADTAMALWQRLDEEMVKAAAEGDEKRLRSRSWIHVAYREAKEQSREDAPLLEQLKELIDTFYNARLAQSAYAEHGFLSSVPRGGGNDLEQVNDLALGVIGSLRPATRRPPVDGVFTAPANAPQLAVPTLRRLFQAYWEIIADDERHDTWQKSCKRVNDLLVAGRPGDQATARARDWTGRFRAAWADHMSLLSRQLPEVVRNDDNTLRVKVQVEGAEYQQAHSAWLAGDEDTRPLSAEEAEAILATGRYVSDVAGWVSE